MTPCAACWIHNELLTFRLPNRLQTNFICSVCSASHLIQVPTTPPQEGSTFFPLGPSHPCGHSVFDLAMVMHELKGDPVLLALQLVFVCFVPLLKWWVTVGLWITVARARPPAAAE